MSVVHIQTFVLQALHEFRECLTALFTFVTWYEITESTSRSLTCVYYPPPPKTHTHKCTYTLTLQLQSTGEACLEIGSAPPVDLKKDLEVQLYLITSSLYMH